jgi:type IV secretion system protein VirB9
MSVASPKFNVIGPCAAWMLAFTLADAAVADALPIKGSVDSRIRTATYSADEVYRLHAFVGYEVELIFEEGETFAGNGGGDLDGIAFGSHTNHLILKPKAANIDTNLVIYTNRRAYRFDYSVAGHKPNSRTEEVIYAIRFIYPASLAAKSSELMSMEQTDRALALADLQRSRNIDYWYCGSPSIKPIAVSDDGVHTRLTFGVKTELPAIFVRNDDGSESLLNFSMDEGDLVIHRVAKKFIVRRGSLTGCIVNKGFSGGGERLDSGTVAPDVKRQRKEGSE